MLGDIREGLSGGPIVAEDGTVAGITFKGQTDEDRKAQGFSSGLGLPVAEILKALSATATANPANPSLDPVQYVVRVFCFVDTADLDKVGQTAPIQAEVIPGVP